jgi:hypothetical protein
MSIIDDIFSPIYGKPCWNFQQGYGSFLTLEIGEPHLKIREPHRTTAQASEGVRKRAARRSVYVYGEYHLWIYLCDWRIYSHGQLLARSDATRRVIKQATCELDGQALIHVSIDESFLSVFEFDLGGRLEASPNVEAYGSDAELWKLFEPSGEVFSLRSDRQYSHMPGNTPRDEEIWQPLNLQNLSRKSSFG